MRHPPTSTLFPYTTLFRSYAAARSLTTRNLFVTKGFDRVEARGFPGGVHAKNNADKRAHHQRGDDPEKRQHGRKDRKSTRLNSSHRCISYAVFCLKKKKKK